MNINKIWIIIKYGTMTLLVDVILQRMLYLSYGFQHKLPLFPHLFPLSFYLAIQVLTFICVYA